MNLYLITIENNNGTKLNMLQEAKDIKTASNRVLTSDIVDNAMTEFHIISVTHIFKANRSKKVNAIAKKHKGKLDQYNISVGKYKSIKIPVKSIKS